MAISDPVYVYRGIHIKHPALAAARQGRVFPGDRNGRVTPEQHYSGGVSAVSQYTSWSYDYKVARSFAADGIGMGVVLRLLRENPTSNAEWQWVRSPGEMSDEQEVLLLGSRDDAEVVDG